VECPFFGTRQIRNDLRKLGHRVGRNRIRRLMKIMGIEALCPKPSTSTPSPAHKKYPYLLRNGGFNPEVRESVAEEDLIRSFGVETFPGAPVEF
jgi:hypothetical protein